MSAKVFLQTQETQASIPRMNVHLVVTHNPPIRYKGKCHRAEALLTDFIGSPQQTLNDACFVETFCPVSYKMVSIDRDEKTTEQS